MGSRRSVSSVARRLRAVFHGILTLGGGGLLGLPCGGPSYKLRIDSYELIRHPDRSTSMDPVGTPKLCAQICGAGVTECEVTVDEPKTEIGGTLHTTCFQAIGTVRRRTTESPPPDGTSAPANPPVNQALGPHEYDIPPEGMPCPSDQSRGERCVLKAESDMAVQEWQLTQTLTDVETLKLCMSACPSRSDYCRIVKTPKGASLSCQSTEEVYSGAGRRPPGLCAAERPLRDIESAHASMNGSAGEHLAGAARMEAAAVTAFRILRGELRRFGAPNRLLRGASRAMREEVRHARSVSALARRRGHRPESPRIEETAPRSLLSLAIDNAVEGCVRETYGALVATWQSRSAKDRHVREAMSRIADDETRHAALSWEIHAWIAPRLTPDERALVQGAMQTAVLDLARDVAERPAPSFAAELGLPTSTEAQILARELSNRLLSTHRLALS